VSPPAATGGSRLMRQRPLGRLDFIPGSGGRNEIYDGFRAGHVAGSRSRWTFCIGRAKNEPIRRFRRPNFSTIGPKLPLIAPAATVEARRGKPFDGQFLGLGSCRTFSIQAGIEIVAQRSCLGRHHAHHGRSASPGRRPSAHADHGRLARLLVSSG